MHTHEEYQKFKSGQAKGDCDACFEYSGYNAVKCPLQAEKVKCDVLRIVRERKKC